MKKKVIRNVSRILAAVMLLTVFSCIAGLPALADTYRSYDFENYTYANGKDGRTMVAGNAASSSEEAYSGTKSLKLAGSGTSKSAYFALGTGTAVSDQCTVERNKKYIISFKYYVKTTLKDPLIFKALYGAYNSRSSKATFNSESYTYTAEAAANTGVWLNGAFILDTSVIKDDAGVYAYMTVSGISDGVVVYVDDVKIENYTDDSVIFINDIFAGDFPAYVSGTAGEATAIEIPEAAKDKLFSGFYKNAVCTYTAEEGRTEIKGRTFVNFTFKTGQTTVYTAFPTKRYFGFEDYRFKNEGGNVHVIDPKTVTVSDTVAYRGKQSIAVAPTSGYFVLGEGVSHSDEAEITIGKKYLISFKYYIEGNIMGSVVFSAVCGKAQSRWYSAAGSCDGFAVSSTAKSGTWLSGSFVIDTAPSSDPDARYMYFNCANNTTGNIYIDDVEMIDIYSGQSFASIHNEVDLSTPAYVIGVTGDTFRLPADVSAEDRIFGGYFYDLACTSNAVSNTVTVDGKRYSEIMLKTLQTHVYLSFTMKTQKVTFETYYDDFMFGVYKDYAGMDADYELYTGEAGEDGFVLNGNTSLHRIGNDKYFRAAMLLGTKQAISPDKWYRITMRVKMDKYAQTKGAVKIIRTNSESYPWSTATCTSGNWRGNYKSDYFTLVPIADLTDGLWHEVSLEFPTNSPFISLETPGYCSLYFDDIEFTLLDGTGSTKSVSFTEYTVTDLGKDPEYVISGAEENIFGFEHYNFDCDKDTVSFTSDAAKGKKAAYFEKKGGLKLKDDIKDGTTYKITFSAKSGKGGNVAFFTADENGTNRSSYTDEGNTAEISGGYKQYTVYITSDLSYSTAKNGFEQTENRTDVIGDKLYIEADAGVTVDDVKITEVENFLTSSGASVLTDAAAADTDNQAVRYYFDYASEDGVTVSFDGKDYTVIKRGIALRRGDLTHEAENGYIYAGGGRNHATVYVKTENFDEVWAEADGKLTFSFYTVGFAANDTRSVAARGFAELRGADGKVITLYSDTYDVSVTKVKKYLEMDLGKNYHNVGGTSLNNYTIVLPFAHSYLLTEAANDLQSYFASVGQTVNITFDKDIIREKEIIIGGCDRDECKGVTAEGDNYIIKCVTRKPIIAGGSDLAVYAAVEDLISLMKTYSARGKGLGLPANSIYMRGSYTPSEYTYQLTFSDEFEGSTIDTKKWQNYSGWGVSWGQGNRFGGTCYRISPLDGDVRFVPIDSDTEMRALYLTDGVCVMNSGRIKSRRTDTYTYETGPNDTIGGVLSTIKTMHFSRGIIEFRVRQSFQNVYTTCWINGDTNGGREVFPESRRTAFTEFDISESFAIADYAVANIHKWWGGSYGSYYHNSLDSNTSDGTRPSIKGIYPSNIADYIGDDAHFGTEYHTFTLARDDDYCDFAVDGKVFYHYDSSKYKSITLNDLQNFILITSAMDAYTPGTDRSVQPIYVDYVRLYQNFSRGAKIRVADSN